MAPSAGRSTTGELQPFTTTWLLGSGGAMGKCIAAFDWSKHPLGPIESWPQSLKTIIHTMLHSRYAMWMGWGPEFYFFCNDAYLATLGMKSNRVLGASARKVWAGIWPDIGPRAESVVQTGKAMWDESLTLFLERSGYVEETYYTFSYSPIADDSGSIGGMLCVVTEDTERVVQARRLDLLRKLGADLDTIDKEDDLYSSLRMRLADYGKDLPFALVYIFSVDGARADLLCAHGAQPGDGVAPEAIATNSRETVWPARQMYNGTAVFLIENLTGRSEVPTGPWRVAPNQAVVLPIARRGQEKPAGFLVAGVNPFRLFDDDYRAFIQLLTGQIAAAIASVRAYEEERRRVEAVAQIDRAKTTFFSSDSEKPTVIGGIPTDITERKRVETALRDSEERVQQLLTLMPAAVYTCDEAGRINYFNRRAAELWGREPLLGESLEKFSGSYRLWRPDGSLLPREQTPMAVAVREGASVRNTEVVIEQPNGTRLVINANIEPLHDHLGRRIGAISVFEDISKRKMAEQELRRQTAHIQLLSETLAQLLRASDPESIIRNLYVKVAAHVGADSYFNFMLNEKEEGLDLHSCAGVPDDVVKSIAHLDFGQAICGTVALTHQPITANDIQNSDYDKAALVKKLGIQTYACNPLMVGDRLFGTLSFASHTRKSFGADELEFLRIISQYAAIAMDRLRTAKALGESEERLRRQAHELEQQLIATGRLVSLGEITASMAHEFNNPLGIILGFVEDLLLSTHPAESNYRPLQIVNDEAKRCQRIIQDLMDYTRPRAVALSSTSLNLVIAKTLSLVETRLYKQKIKLETALDKDLPNVYADYQQLEQVFVNLYLNAIDAMPSGGILSVSAKVLREHEDATVLVAVADTGFGIEQEFLGKIFQPFYTAKKTRGMGLGLPICERIVRNHGGYIEVQSTVGQGTTFKVYLPLIESKYAARPHSL